MKNSFELFVPVSNDSYKYITAMA